MKNSILKNMLIVLGILAMLVFYFYFVADNLDRAITTAPKMFSGLNFNKVSRIEVKQTSEVLTLEKVGAGWKINEKTADSELINKLISEVKQLEIVETISKNAENHASFGVDTENGFELYFYQGDKKAGLIVGNSASSDVDAFYLKKPNTDYVYLAKGALRGSLSTQVDYYRDKTVVKIDLANVSKLVLTGGTNKVFEKNAEGKWLLAGTALDADTETKFSSVFNPLVAYGFATPEETLTWDSIWGKTELRFYDTKSNELAKVSVGKTDAGYLVLKNSEPDLFKLTLSQLDFLLEAAE